MASRLVRLCRRDNLTAPSLQRSPSMETFSVRVYPGSVQAHSGSVQAHSGAVQMYSGSPLADSDDDVISIDCVKNTTATEVVTLVTEQLGLPGRHDDYELAETFCSGGHVCKERRLEGSECPVKVQTLWPKVSALIAERHRTEYRFQLCGREPHRKTGEWMEYAEPNPADMFLTRFLQQSAAKKEYCDLCNLPDLNERTLLENLRRRFTDQNIYTYVGSILISVNPFCFFPIYNPQHVALYQKRRQGELPPHIFAIADAAYHTMLRDRHNQCIVISGESGSGKTESTNLLLHHLSALSQKAHYSGGIEQTILGAGPVLEAFGNAKTVHNHNSSRFGKFIQVNYKENGMIHGAIVEKYLLEKSRIVSQSKNERNYHVFYYLLAGANEHERESLGLQDPQHYFYLNQSDCYTMESLEGVSVDEAYELTRLRQSMEMVGFSMDTQRRIFSVLAAVLHLGNISFKKKADHAHHEAVAVQNSELVETICDLLKVRDVTMLEALTKRKTMAGGETVVMNHRMADAIATRDAMAKCLYGALFDWIVLQINHMILSKREYKEHQGNSIGVLDIFGFEDFDKNSFEQFCINYANEHLHYYFNQHIFKFEQEEYLREGIQWKNIEFLDNTGCLDLFSKRPTGLLSLLDEECNFPGATNETLLAKFHAQHTGDGSYEEPQMKESAFAILHYAGKVKYLIQDFREKNSDLIRHDIVLLLKNSNLAFVRELVGYDPVAVLRWSILRAFFRAFFAFRAAGVRHRQNSGNNSAMTRVGSVKKLKAQWDRNKAGDPNAEGDASHAPLSRRVQLNSQSRLEMALKLRNTRTNQKRGSSSAPSSPVNSAPQTPPTEMRDKKPGGKRRISSMGVLPSLSAEDITESTINKSTITKSTITASTIAASRRPTGDSTPQEDAEEDTKAPHTEAKVTARSSSARSSPAKDVWGSNGSRDPADQVILRRASKLLMKNKSFRPRTRTAKQFRDLKTMKSLAGRKALGPRPSKGKNKPPSISAQFNYSLGRLMESLNQANPFFIRCLKSNTEKAPCVFDEEIVLRQLRYTGMLATVRLRQSGYNYRLTMEEFLHQYKVLLPRGLVSSREDIHSFLRQFDQLEENFQIGKNKVFLRETDKLVLDDMLHCAIMQRIMCIQRWLKSKLERRRFIKIRMATLVIQCCVRSFVARRRARLLRQIRATVLIQRMFRGFRQRRLLANEHSAAVTIQKHLRGLLCRTRFGLMRQESARDLDTTEPLEDIPTLEQPAVTMTTTDTAEPVSPVTIETRRRDVHDFHSSASDEGILSKELSSEEFLADKDDDGARKAGESEGSSGILEDSESEVSVYGTKSRTASLTSPASSVPPSPFTPDPPGGTSTPGGPRLTPKEGVAPRDRVPSEPFQDIVDFHYPGCLRRSQSHQVTDKPRAHSVAVGHGAAQQSGPQDLELRVGPVAKAASEEFLQTYETTRLRDTTPRSAFIKAPLAQQDHFSEFEESLHKHHSPLLGPKKQTSLSSLADSASLSSQGTAASLKSPFHKARKQIKQLVSGGKKKKEEYDSDDSQTEDANTTKVVVTKTKASVPEEPADLPDAKNKHRRKNSKKRRPKTKDIAKTQPSAQTITVAMTSSATVATTTWSVSSTSPWLYPTKDVITTTGELRQLEMFMSQKLQKLAKGGKRETVFDEVFRTSLEEFQKDLLMQIPVIQEKDAVRSYQRLMTHFEGILGFMARTRFSAGEEFPDTVGINAFRGFLDEFCKRKDNRELPEVKVKKEKRKKDNILEHNGHRYLQAQFSIHTVCEFCSSHIWLLEKAYVCQACQYTVHKKCYPKSNFTCRKGKSSSNQGVAGKLVFGVPLDVVLGPDERIPGVIDRLISTIEIQGLYTEGLYRKVGGAARIRELIKAIDTAPDSVELTDVHIHVLTSVMKRFLHDLPEPLLTHAAYDDLIIATDISDERERVQSLYSTLEKLPQSHHDLLERLVFHLAKVAQHEASNKMSPGGLAIIFAPSLLRTDRPQSAQESLNMVNKQSMCVQTIIEEQMKKLETTLADISTLNSATHTAKYRLLAVRASMQAHDKGAVSVAPGEDSDEVIQEDVQEEEQLLSEQIAYFEQRKETLTATLHTLASHWSSSEEDLLHTDDELETPPIEPGLVPGEVEGCCQYTVSLEYPASPPQSLTHLNKRRVPLPRRQISTPRKRVRPATVDGGSDEGDDTDEVPRRNALASPALKTVGSEIIV